MLRDGWWRTFRASFVLHLAIALLIGVGGILAGRVALPGGIDPYSRVLGWKEVADAAGAKARAEGFRAIATDQRSLAAELLYYLRDAGIPVVALRGGDPPSDHFELTHPLTDATPRPVLLVSFRSRAPKGSRPLGSETIPAGPTDTRKVHFYALEAGR